MALVRKNGARRLGGLGVSVILLVTVPALPAEARGMACPDAYGSPQVRTLHGTNGDDTISPTQGPSGFSTNAHDVIASLDGADEIHAGGGADLVCGDQMQSAVGGDDRIRGDEGSDTIVSDAGEDSLDGGPGIDTYVVSDFATQGADVRLDAAEGSCGAGWAQITNDGFGFSDCVRNFENVVSISQYDDILQGDAGPNVVSSRFDIWSNGSVTSGADTLKGKGGNDTLSSAEVDLVVDAGNDGGPGVDVCTRDPADVTSINCEA